MGRFRVYPYKLGSKSAKELARGLGVLRIKHDGRFRGRPSDVILNWGNGGSHANLGGAKIINPFEAVNIAGSKRLTFQKLAQHIPSENLPRFQVQGGSLDELARWEYTYVFRTLDRASEGRGIVLADSLEEAPPQYSIVTEYVPKRVEVRLHIFQNPEGEYEYIHGAQKRRTYEIDDEDVNWQIRNHHNGWIFAIQGFEPPVEGVTLAKDVVASLGLNFGAVDMVLSTRDGKWKALEVNTAPGLEGTTLDVYKRKVQEWQNLVS